MIILGISGFENGPVCRLPLPQGEAAAELPLQLLPLSLIGHDCAASLIVDGQLVAAAAEERFTRIKHGYNLSGQPVLPRMAIDYCLRTAGVSPDQIDCVAHYCNFTNESVANRLDKVSAGLDKNHRDAICKEYSTAYRNRLNRQLIREQLERIIGIPLNDDRFLSVEHHLAHSAGAFYSSPFEESLICSVDGYGEEDSSLYSIGSGNEIIPVHRIKLPTSLGLLYQLITVFLGFRSFGDEYKVMGLSSYGDRDRFKHLFEDIIKLESDGNYTIPDLADPNLNQKYAEQFGKISWENGFSQKAADLAAALQDALERTLLHSLTHWQNETGLRNLCMSGGVALNAVANGVITRSTLFDRFYFQPAAGDDGASLGAALYAHNKLLGQSRSNPIIHAFWGPSFDSNQVRQVLLNGYGVKWKEVDDIELSVAQLLASGNIVGWFQGRMEMGPRALGARSILCDPRSIEVRDHLNLKIKNRELFRPFAPAVLKDHAARYFDLSSFHFDPYMITVVNAHEDVRQFVPAVVHVDGTSRLQVVNNDHNSRYYRLINHFYKLTRVPMILNTSFNRAGEPIVCTIENAIDCAARCNLDALAIENILVFPMQKTEDRSCRA